MGDRDAHKSLLGNESMHVRWPLEPPGYVPLPSTADERTTRAAMSSTSDVSRNGAATPSAAPPIPVVRSSAHLRPQGGPGRRRDPERLARWGRSSQGMMPSRSSMASCVRNAVTFVRALVSKRLTAPCVMPRYRATARCRRPWCRRTSTRSSRSVNKRGAGRHVPFICLVIGGSCSRSFRVCGGGVGGLPGTSGRLAVKGYNRRSLGFEGLITKDSNTSTTMWWQQHRRCF